MTFTKSSSEILSLLPQGIVETPPWSIAAMIEHIRRCLIGKHTSRWILIATFALTLPSLITGLAGDDYFIRAVMMRNASIPGMPRSVLDAFPFTKGDPSVISDGIEVGMYPWWTHPRHKISFLRPLSSFTHWIDFNLFPDSPWLMHIHSMVWYSLLMYVSALLYRRFLSVSWVAALATLLYCIDYSHAIAVGSLCNRYAIIAAVFGFLTVLAHDRWRHSRRRSAGAFAIGCFILALLTGEAGVAAGAYLIAYAMFLDTGKPLMRYAVLLPYVVLGIVWRIIYTRLDFGAAHSGVYIDPTNAPLRFAMEMTQRLPVLLLGQIALPSSDLFAVLSTNQAKYYAVFAGAVILCCAWLLWPLLQKERALCFFGIGMMLSAIPFCATLPSNRFLFFTGLGCMGIIARFLGAIREKALFSTSWGKLRITLAVIWIGIHIVLSSLLFVPLTLLPMFLQRPFTLAAETLPQPGEAISAHRVIVVNMPSDLMLFYVPFLHTVNGKSRGLRLFLLSAGLLRVELERVDDHTLEVCIPEGLLSGKWNQFFRDPGEPLPPNVPLRFSDVTVTVTDITPEGLPSKMRYEFSRPLEDPYFSFVRWTERGFVPFALPSPGTTVTFRPLPKNWLLKTLFHKTHNTAY
ncbi:MAG: hypothetical protein N3B18_12175 [Desulfobacterota bacterium]|nr:hypothetical protein [Thermodesulfobacteriota bacterium]